MRLERIDDLAFVIHEALDEHECLRLIEDAQQIGFDLAPIKTSRGELLVQSVRNNTRAMVDDADLADDLWRVIEPWVPQVLKSVYWGSPPSPHQMAGLNERLRFYRYTAGQRFKFHTDGVFHRQDGSGEFSMFSVIIYLNGDCEGGETRIVAPNGTHVVRPEPGKVLVFQHHLLHEGAEVTAGIKNVLRSDIMMRPDHTV